MPVSRLDRAVRRVVESGNCSGCGACAALFPGVEMKLSDTGYMRPAVRDAARDERAAARRFARVCPGSRLTAPPVPPGAEWHPTFGRHISVWRGWATDAAVRRAGSSAGVLTALSAFLVETGQVDEVIGAAADPHAPRRTVAVRIQTKEDALRAAGSRYAPVAVAAAVTGSSRSAVVGKPCEISALRQADAEERRTASTPRLSFFCAGTPSQLATDELVSGLGVNRDRLVSLRYRGDGWPGRFTATDAEGVTGDMSYEESWGGHLGRALQSRCKLCPDGTGEHADVSVGDFWKSDASGYPVFEDGDGACVMIARTERGHALLQAAMAAGRIAAVAVDLAEVERVQPLQRDRRRSLLGRLVGRRLAGYAVPRYRNYGLVRQAVRRPKQNLRALRGMWSRSRRSGS